ncbi:hypothetical protein SDC9_16889 [bioreactor metagenome]|uniref:Uncharacterized protein n=1 Tax=bioreactor metagenome TaxID=1076179 RepID=A0A644TVU6_9ZZZZ
MLFVIRKRLFLLSDDRPDLGIFAVQLDPALHPRLGVRADRVGGAFGFAHAAIDAFVGVDHQRVLALVEAVHRADLDTVGVLAGDAIVGDDIGHGEPPDRLRFFRFLALPCGSIKSAAAGKTGRGILAAGSGRAFRAFGRRGNAGLAELEEELGRLGRGAAAGAAAEEVQNPHPSGDRKGQNIARADGAARLVGAVAVHPDPALRHQLGGQRAGLHHARVPQPFVEADALRVVGQFRACS